MKILMIAPEPFFESRGTPFSEYYRIKALTALNHTVDLVTYPLGQDKKIKGLKIYRSFLPPFIKRVKTGPTWTKVILDIFLVFKVIQRLLTEKYDLIHTHEEANIMGVFFNKLTGIPHLYDMHASLVQHMSNFQFTRSRFIIGIFKLIERLSLTNARSIIVICRSLYDYAATITGKEKLTIIENFYDETPVLFNEAKLETIKQEIESLNHKIVLYAGTLEKYQGMPLLLKSLALLPKHFTLVLIGGEKNQIDLLKAIIEKMRLTDRVKILGKRSPEDIPFYLKAAHVLVSPRSRGTNIPLKVYSYLKSGTPLVATNLYTHTQSINPDIAILVDPQPEPMAQGIIKAASDQGQSIARNAVHFCLQNYTFTRYHELVNTALGKATTVK